MADANPLAGAQIQNLVTGPANGLLWRDAGHISQGAIPGLDDPVGVDNHYPITAMPNNSIQALSLSTDLLVQPGIVNRNSSLISKGAQHLAIISGKFSPPSPKDEDITNRLLPDF